VLFRVARPGPFFFRRLSADAQTMIAFVAIFVAVTVLAAGLDVAA
jgi:hypothetical protein